MHQHLPGAAALADVNLVSPATIQFLLGQGSVALVDLFRIDSLPEGLVTDSSFLPDSVFRWPTLTCTAATIHPITLIRPPSITRLATRIRRLTMMTATPTCGDGLSTRWRNRMKESIASRVSEGIARLTRRMLSI